MSANYFVTCSADVLQGVCANCGGNPVPRPIRPAHSRRPGTGLDNHPAGTKRRFNRYTPEERADLSNRLKDVRPHERWIAVFGLFPQLQFIATATDLGRASDPPCV